MRLHNKRVWQHPADNIPTKRYDFKIWPQSRHDSYLPPRFITFIKNGSPVNIPCVHNLFTQMKEMMPSRLTLPPKDIPVIRS